YKPSIHIFQPIIPQAISDTKWSRREHPYIQQHLMSGQKLVGKLFREKRSSTEAVFDEADQLIFDEITENEGARIYEMSCQVISIQNFLAEQVPSFRISGAPNADLADDMYSSAIKWNKRYMKLCMRNGRDGKLKGRGRDLK